MVDNTQQLIDLARQGDGSAISELLDRHRPRLRKLVAARMDERLSSRVDPSDIVQETMLTAFQRLPEYFHRSPYPFYPWLRQIAWDRLRDASRRHIEAGKRSVDVEEPIGLSDASLADLVSQSTDPGLRVQKAEWRARIRNWLSSLAEPDREILIMKHVESMDNLECAAALQISVVAVKKRYLRALSRFRAAMDDSTA
jgi:RNA polymerase sigma-70 factor, ECF subfamily